MPIGKINSTSGKGADYSAGSQNIQHTVEQSKPGATCTPLLSPWILYNSCFPFSGGGKAQVGYQKTSAQHAYGAGALNIKATTEVPKVRENLVYGKADGSGTSQYGSGAMGIQSAVNAPKIKHEGLSAVDKTIEQVHNA